MSSLRPDDEAIYREIEFVCVNSDFPETATPLARQERLFALLHDIPDTFAYRQDFTDARHVEVAMAVVLIHPDTESPVRRAAEEAGVAIDVVGEVTYSESALYRLIHDVTTGALPHYMPPPPCAPSARPHPAPFLSSAHDARRDTPPRARGPRASDTATGRALHRAPCLCRPARSLAGDGSTRAPCGVGRWMECCDSRAPPTWGRCSKDQHDSTPVRPSGPRSTQLLRPRMRRRCGRHWGVGVPASGPADGRGRLSPHLIEATRMLPTRTDYAFWTARRRPRWAAGLANVPAPTIHDCVNAHAGPPVPLSRQPLEAHNLLALLRMRRRQSTPLEDMRTLLLRIAYEPAGTDSRRRQAFARRWLDRMPPTRCDRCRLDRPLVWARRIRYDALCEPCNTSVPSTRFATPVVAPVVPAARRPALAPV